MDKITHRRTDGNEYDLNFGTHLIGKVAKEQGTEKAVRGGDGKVTLFKFTPTSDLTLLGEQTERTMKGLKETILRKNKGLKEMLEEMYASDVEEDQLEASDADEDDESDEDDQEDIDLG